MPRVISAPDWVANDLPLNYQFGSRLSASLGFRAHILRSIAIRGPAAGTYRSV